MAGIGIEFLAGGKTAAILPAVCGTFTSGFHFHTGLIAPRIVQIAASAELFLVGKGPRGTRAAELFYRHLARGMTGRTRVFTTAGATLGSGYVATAVIAGLARIATLAQFQTRSRCITILFACFNARCAPARTRPRTLHTTTVFHIRIASREVVFPVAAVGFADSVARGIGILFTRSGTGRRPFRADIRARGCARFFDG